MTLMVLVGIALALFALAYVTKRRYGVLGLGLTAGLVLSRELTKDTASFLQSGDFPVEPLSHMTVAGMFLILAPALALMIAGPKYTDKRFVIVGSALFAVFGTVLILIPLSLSLQTTDQSIQPMLSLIASNSSWITSVGVIAAVFDLMNTHGKKSHGKKDKH